MTSHAANRLIREKSPYLLQHAFNPVDWYPWGEEAFALARAQGKIVFLSIGYATCHWCHVMERETFEDPAAAAVINRLSIPVKVDREERPDLDQIYMGVCHALTGAGGWPLTIFLTPERLPFFAGTYFPPRSRQDRLGLLDLLERAAGLWQEHPQRVIQSAQDIVDHLQAVVGEGWQGRLRPALLKEAAETLRRTFDSRRGGFGPPPKFPTPHNLIFLLRRARRLADPSLLPLVETSLVAMRQGGIWDQLGGGFHRYATDADWLVPHFEKMLYDQAGLAMACLEACQACGRAEFGTMAAEILQYVDRDLTGPEGAFWAAEDADTEGVEGKYYLWRRSEILERLGVCEGDLFCRVYGVREEGNFRDEASGQVSGQNILHLTRPLDAWARELALPLAELEARLAASRQQLLAARVRRVRPARDDKVVAGWNGLMISALARAATVLEDERYARQAEQALAFVLGTMMPAGQLHRRWRQGELAVPAFAEDYAFLARACLDLYRATFQAEHLRQALTLANELWHRFRDEAHGNLFDTAHDAEALVLRPKEVYDGTTPSANSVALEVFARLGLLLAAPAWTERAQALASACAGRVETYPAAFCQFLTGAALLLEPGRQVAIAGPPEAAGTRALLAVLGSTYCPETQVLLAAPGEETVAELAPFTRAMHTGDGRAWAQVCQGTSCLDAIAEPEKLRRLLAVPPAG
ncbi:MAG: thioredoxin domain-containing protein [Thermodesulfobacteriota bacterium]